MFERWPTYKNLPANGQEFEKYVGTIFFDLGYIVETTPRTNDYGADLILTEPPTGIRIAVQTKFYNRGSINNAPIQEVVGSLKHYNATAAWVVTNAKDFTDNAKTLAAENDITLIANDYLNQLREQAEWRVNSISIPSGFQQDSHLQAYISNQGTVLPSYEFGQSAVQQPVLSTASQHPLTMAQNIPGYEQAVRAQEPASIQLRQGNTRYENSRPVNPVASTAVISADQVNALSAKKQPSKTASTTTKTSGSTSSQQQTATSKESKQNQRQTTYNMQDILLRWNCPRSFVDQQIRRGFPIRKKSNGRWEITEQELLAWEQAQQQLQEKKIRTRKRVRTIKVVLVLVLIIAIATLFWVYSNGMLPIGG